MFKSSELSLIFWHLVYLTQAIRIGFVLLLKQSWCPRISSLPAGQKVSIYILTVHGGHDILQVSTAPQGTQGSPAWCKQPSKHPKPWGHLCCAPTEIPTPKPGRSPKTAEKSTIVLSKERCVLKGENPVCSSLVAQTLGKHKQSLHRIQIISVGIPLCSRRWAEDPQSLGFSLFSRERA